MVGAAGAPTWGNAGASSQSASANASASSPSPSASSGARSCGVSAVTTSASASSPNTSASANRSASSSSVSEVTSASASSPSPSASTGASSHSASDNASASNCGINSLTSASTSPLESLPPEILNLILDALVLARCHSPATDGCCRNACLCCRTPWAPCPAPHGPLAQPQCGVRELKALLLASKALSAAVKGVPSFQALLLSVSIARGARGEGGSRGGGTRGGGTRGGGTRGGGTRGGGTRGEGGTRGGEVTSGRGSGEGGTCGGVSRGGGTGGSTGPLLVYRQAVQPTTTVSSLCSRGESTTDPFRACSQVQGLQGVPVGASQQNTTAIRGTTVTTATTLGTVCVTPQQGLHGVHVVPSVSGEDCRQCFNSQEGRHRVHVVPSVSGEDSKQWVRSLYLRELTETPGIFGTFPKISGILGASKRYPWQEHPPSPPCHCIEGQVVGCHCIERQGTGRYCTVHRPSLRCADQGDACWGHHGTAFTGTECHCTDRADAECHCTDRANTECQCTDSANTERQCTESTVTRCDSTERHECTECDCTSATAEAADCSGCGHWLCPELQQYSAVVVLHLPHWFNDRLAHALGGLRSLRALCLRGCAVGDATLAELATASSATAGGLRELDLASTGVSSAGIFHLEKLEFLKILNLSFCRGVCPQSGVPLQRLRALEELYLCGTVVSDDTMGLISSLPRLRRVDLEGCEGVSDAGLDVIDRVLATNRSRKESLCQRAQWGRSFMEVSYLE